MNKSFFFQTSKNTAGTMVLHENASLEALQSMTSVNTPSGAELKKKVSPRYGGGVIEYK